MRATICGERRLFMVVSRLNSGCEDAGCSCCRTIALVAERWKTPYFRCNKCVAKRILDVPNRGILFECFGLVGDGLASLSHALLAIQVACQSIITQGVGEQTTSDASIGGGALVSVTRNRLLAMFVTRPTRHPLSAAGRLLFPVGFPHFSSPRRGSPCDGPRKHSETKPIRTPAHALPLLSPIPLHVVGTAWSRNTSLRSPPY